MKAATYLLKVRLQSSKEAAPSAFYNVVDPAYFPTMRIPLLRGRLFTDQDTAKTPRVAVISEAMANKLWPGQDAVGKRFSDTAAIRPVH